MNTQNYAVNIRVGLANPVRVNISQDDTGRTLAFSLYDGLSPFTPPTGSTVTIVGRKPSKLGFSETCTVSGNVATVATTLAMTQEAGKFPAELRIEAGGQSIGTANFTMYVEPSPHPDGTTDGTHATVDNLQTQIGNLANLTTTAKTNLVSAINEAAQSGGTEVVIDNTLTKTGQAADAKKTGDEISQIKADLDDLDDRVTALEEGGGGGMTDNVKTALMNLVNHLAWDDDDPTGQTYITALYNALYPPADLVSISAVYTQSGAIYESNTLDDLKDDLVVTALMSDQTTRPVTDYTLSGTLTEGTSTITVSYSGKTTTFNVTVSHETVFVRNIIDYATVVREHAYGVNNSTVNESWPEVVYSIPDVKSGDVLILPNGSNEGTWVTYRNIGKVDKSSSAPQLTLGEWVKVGSQYGYYPITVNEDLDILYVRFKPAYSSAATWTRESGF